MRKTANNYPPVWVVLSIFGTSPLLMVSALALIASLIRT